MLGSNTAPTGKTATKRVATGAAGEGASRPVTADPLEDGRTQFAQDLPHPGAPAWKAKPITVLPVWEAQVGDSIVGEYAGCYPDREYWGAIIDRCTILLRISTCTDQPVRIIGLDVVAALREIKPDFGTALVFTRLPDQPRWKKRPTDVIEPLMGEVYSVELVKREDTRNSD